MMREFWLAEVTGRFPQGHVAQVSLCDGPHSNEQGVAKAFDLYRRLKFSLGKQYCVVEVSPIPNFTGSINEEAADACASMLDAARTPDEQGRGAAVPKEGEGR